MFGRSVAQALSELGMDVLAVDKAPLLVDGVKDLVVAAVCLDVTDERALLEAEIHKVDVAVVAIGEAIEASILVTALLKKHGVPHIIARAQSELHAQVLEAVGANRIVDPEREIGQRIAHEIYAPDVYSRIKLSSGQEVIEFEARKQFIGKTLGELKFRERFGLNIVAIKRLTSKGEGDGQTYKVIKVPGPSDEVQEGDVIVAIGDEDTVARFLQL